MKHLVRAACVATMLSSVVILGGAGAATAAPLHDPYGFCNSHNQQGNCLYGAAGPARSIDVTIPADDPQEQAIIDYVTRAVDNFNADATDMESLGDSELPSTITVTSTDYASGTPATGTQTVVVALDQMLRHAAHPAAWFQAFSYNHATRSPITFDTLFRPGTAPLSVIVPIVEQQLSSTAGQPITLDSATATDPGYFQNFAVTDDAVIFFFGRGDIAPAFGATQVSVPRSAIADILSPGL
ncbi:hypothetical protein BVC93_17300 [Mycobacterium sp. MS1601]|uniref:RsiV family protein n=1 Tax=Mycobacterium sp. MS1601 TaxID=1936029 RepID=UPI0009796B4F|nr:RsiV family protein [Mycobacterium sp. MS1601]AQA03894.1 hypothetical protein BVC93_17300 [Mycobacterium sp. MS1601]